MKDFLHLADFKGRTLITTDGTSLLGADDKGGIAEIMTMVERILSEKIPGLDCISVGPNLKEIHTIKERASISSVARVWEFIKAVLAYK